jgi:transcription initiation factor TFIIF subunit alpha
MMKLNSTRDVNPASISKPILMNRKQPGEKVHPTIAFDIDGNHLGRYVLDEQGRPLLDDEGKAKVEYKVEGKDMSLVGTAPGEEGRKKNYKKGVREVFHQDKEKMRLRREEAMPWILEAKEPMEKPPQPEHWVGRMMESATLPTVLLVNDGQSAGFSVIPLGRTYKFEPERPFKVMDLDAANKLVGLLAEYR